MVRKENNGPQCHGVEFNNILKDLDSTIGNYAVVGNHDMVHLSDYKNIMDGNFNILKTMNQFLLSDLLIV